MCRFLFAGISLVLTVMSRPNMALMSVVMVPLYLNVLCRKDIKTKVKLLSVLSFALPVLSERHFRCGTITRAFRRCSTSALHIS